MSNVENLPPLLAGSNPKPGAVNTKSKSTSSAERKKLQTLQPSGKNKKLLVGSDGLLRMSEGKNEKVKIFEDPKASSTPERKTSLNSPKPAVQECGVQAVAEVAEGETQVEEKDVAQVKAEEFMYGDEFPPEYWKELAEKRREALEASLLENEELHTSLTLVEEEKTALTEERDSLKEMAEQAEELAKIVKGLVTCEEGSEEEASSDEESKTTG